MFSLDRIIESPLYITYDDSSKVSMASLYLNGVQRTTFDKVEKQSNNEAPTEQI